MPLRAQRMMTALFLAGFVLLGAACSTTLTVSKDQVAQQINDQLTQQVGQSPDSVTCPQDLPGQVGATMRCTLTAGGESYGVTVTVTSVEGTNVKFNIQVDDAPATGTPTS